MPRGPRIDYPGLLHHVIVRGIERKKIFTEYKSIVCEEEQYLLELVRYIHLNPLRAGVIKTLDELDKYKWSGHTENL